MGRLDLALQYNRMGFSVIPLKPKDKRPLDKWELFQFERADEVELKRIFAKQPKANVGLVTGEISGIVVVDVDGPEGIETLRREGLDLPPTVTAKTGGGGLHYFFKHPGFECRNFAGGTGGTVLPNVDFRGDGGYVVAPGSVHPNGKKYEWLISPEDEQIAEAPAWLLDLIRGQGQNGRVLAEEWSKDVPKGQRNDTLARMAGSLLAKMSVDDVLPMLKAWNRERCVPPLSEAEVAATVKSIANREADKWTTPKKLEMELLPVEKLPPALIPEPFRPWLEDVAFRMQAPLDFLAVAVMVVTGSVIGTACRIRPKRFDNWTVTPNLWGFVMAEPGLKKTPALLEVLQPLRDMERAARRDHDAEMKVAKLDATVHKAAREGIVGQIRQASKNIHTEKGQERMAQLKKELARLEEEETAAPVRRRFLTSDSTIEKLGELLQENPRGVFVFRDELVGLMATLDREENQAMRAFYLEGWPGDGSFTWDRIGRGTIDNENMAISVFGGIQPSRFLGYLHQMRHDFGNDGLVQRFQLAVYPETPSGFEKTKVTDKSPDRYAKERAARITETLADMDFRQVGAEEEDGLVYLRFGPDAQRLFYEWMDELETRLMQRDENPLVVQHLSKYRSLMPSLALIIHLVDAADGKAEGPVSLLAAQKAAAWCEFLESHARRIYGMGGRSGLNAAQALARKILDGTVVDGFTAREIYRKQWGALGTIALVEEAIAELVAAGWLRGTEIKTGGRPSVQFQINPQVHTRG